MNKARKRKTNDNFKALERSKPMLNDVEEGLAELKETAVESYGSMKEAVAGAIEKQPVATILIAMGAGLLLGRFKVRPIETVLLAAGAGLASGVLLTRTRSRGRGESSRR
jgi:ElaB/YqjD/DUF883 family membrane-anchored ribosome-binding protein